jgi:steroid 5-alpha reductase family enzyme
MMTSLIVTAVVVAMLYFALVWAICVRIKNYGLLDVAWSYGVAILAPCYAIFATAQSLRVALFLSIGLLWSVRLGSYILWRVMRHHPAEDPRYLTLRARWPGRWRFLVFFELQALIAVVFSLPFLFIFFDPSPTLSVLEIGAFTVAVVALLGEMLADRQLIQFKRDPANAGEVCQVGLWRYSRHPNYFFEALFWVGIAAAALGAPYGWISLACPAMMLYFLFRVTGIPLTEAQGIASKGDKYREYQRTTSEFIPWFRRK